MSLIIDNKLAITHPLTLVINQVGQSYKGHIYRALLTFINFILGLFKYPGSNKITNIG